MNFHELFNKLRHGIKVEATNLLRPIIDDSLAELAVGDDAPMAELAKAVSGLRDPMARTEALHDFERNFRSAFGELVRQLVDDALAGKDHKDRKEVALPAKANPLAQGNPHRFDAGTHTPLHQ